MKNSIGYVARLKSRIVSNRHLYKCDILSGITVALALIPESVAFAFVAGVSPILSLQTAVMIGFIAALFTGRPGMISSSTAAISVVIASLVAEHGLEYLFVTVILIGVIQILLGVFKLGKYTRIIPYSVMLGFLNGLSIVIFLAQIDQFKISKLIEIDGVIQSVSTWLPITDLIIMSSFVAFTMLIIHHFPKVTKAVPSSLVAILVTTAISTFLSRNGIYSLRTVQDFAGMELSGGFPSFHLPQASFSFSGVEILHRSGDIRSHSLFEFFSIVFPYALVASLVGLTEAVLTLRVVDEMTDTKGRTNREFFAQGFANLVNGFFGGMGGDAMIGQSIINVKSGGRTRLSGLVAASALMFFLLFGSAFVNSIPLAGLVGVMFMVVLGTFKWESLKYGGKIPKGDIVVVIVVSLVTIFQDLATAVIIGVILSALMFAWEKGKIIYANIDTDSEGVKRYKINGTLFFGSVMNFTELFDVKNDPDRVFLDLRYAKVMDYSAIEAIDSLAGRYSEMGKSLRLSRVSHDCHLLFKNAESITNIDIQEIEELETPPLCEI